MKMQEFQNVIARREEAVLGAWSTVLLETYPADTVLFMKREKDKFANPLGATLLDGLKGLFSALVKGDDPGGMTSFVDSIVRIRAVQEFTPSQAVDFVFSLKEILRRELPGETVGDYPAELLEFDRRIDRLALLAFDIYSACREKLFEIRLGELRSSVALKIGSAGKLSGRREGAQE